VIHCCTDCGNRIFYAKDSNGARKLALNPVPHPDGKNVLIAGPGKGAHALWTGYLSLRGIQGLRKAGVPFYTSHARSCPALEEAA